MQKRQRLGACLLAPLVLLWLPGCGSTGSSATTTTATRAALDVYVTDAFSDQYKQVLVTLYKIELTTDGTTFTTVYSDDAGHTLDLATLSSTAELLASVNIPTGTYTQARVTFGDHFTLVTSAGVSSSVAVASGVGTATNGQVTVTVATPTKLRPGQTNAVYVDFKLAEFQLVGSVLRPALGCGDGSGMGDRKHTAHLQGTIAGLTDTGFSLQGTNGSTTTVTLTATTTLTSGQTGAVTTLANGQNVLVEGTADPTTHVVTATSVTLNDYTTFARERAGGTVASLDASGSTFVLTVQRADGLQPTSGTITVVTNASTRFDKGRRQQGSFADLAVGGNVRAEGTFDVASQTLTARGVDLH